MIAQSPGCFIGTASTANFKPGQRQQVAATGCTPYPHTSISALLSASRDVAPQSHTLGSEL